MDMEDEKKPNTRPPPLEQRPPSPPTMSIAGCATYFPTSVRTAISDWQKLFRVRLDSYLENERNQESLSEAEYSAHLALAHPESDDGRREILIELTKRYYVSFVEWEPYEVELFARLAYPIPLLVTTTTDGKPSAFLGSLYKLWGPSYCFWIEFLWRFVSGARELFADLLYIAPSEHIKTPRDTGRVLFHDMLVIGVYTFESVPSIIGALLSYPDESHYAREHARTIRDLSAHLGPETMGMLVRSLIIHRTHKPASPRDCGYHPNEAVCVCKDTIPGTRLPRALAYDTEKVYMGIVLSLLIGRDGEKEGLRNEGVWGKEMCDLLIVEACEHVFTKATYISVYMQLNAGEQPLRSQMYPRVPIEGEETQHRVEDEDFVNAFVQTGHCVKHDCKQNMKVSCANVSCSTHCPDGYFACRAHRSYSTHKPEYPERPCIATHEEEGRQERTLLARDPDSV